MATPKIAIIGAGPGGCMLARLLHTSNPSIPVTIFESEASVNYRSQGGTLDLRSNSGLAAMKEAKLWDEFQKYARYDGESLLITDKTLVTWMRRSPRKDSQDKKRQLQEAPEIDRKDLRKILMESLPASTVRWGYKVQRVEETSSGLTMHFSNGEALSGYDLIVGCDGAFSKTRTLLSSEKPFYSGLGGWTLHIPHVSSTAPDVDKFVNRGSVFAYSDCKAFSLQQLSEDELHVAYWGPHPENYSRTCGFDASNVADVKAAMKKELADWAPQFHAAIDKARGPAVWRNLYQLPVGFTWPHKRGVTLLGDAAHLMTPFAGIGVNTAFHDAMQLAHELGEFTQGTARSLDDHVLAYEQKMYAFAHRGMQLTQDSMTDMIFTPGAPRASIERWVLRHVKDNFPAWLHPIATGVVYAGYWVYKWFV